MAHPKSRWEDIAQRRDAERAAAVDEGSLETDDIADLEQRVEAAIVRGDQFLVLRHLKPEDVRYPGLGRRLAEAVLGPFLMLNQVKELRSPKWLVREGHQRIWVAVEGMGLVPLLRFSEVHGPEAVPVPSGVARVLRAIRLPCNLVIDLQGYEGKAGARLAVEATSEAVEDDIPFH